MTDGDAAELAATTAAMLNAVALLAACPVGSEQSSHLASMMLEVPSALKMFVESARCTGKFSAEAGLVEQIYNEWQGLEGTAPSATIVAQAENVLTTFGVPEPVGGWRELLTPVENP